MRACRKKAQMKRRETPRVKETKALLRNALLRLLEQRTISKISITALCEEAGVTRATFYKYYGSIEELYDAIIDQHLAELYDAYMKSLEETSDLHAALVTAREFDSCQK